MMDDIDLLVNNAITFNEEYSQIHTVKLIIKCTCTCQFCNVFACCKILHEFYICMKFSAIKLHNVYGHVSCNIWK